MCIKNTQSFSFTQAGIADFNCVRDFAFFMYKGRYEILLYICEHIHIPYTINCIANISTQKHAYFTRYNTCRKSMREF